MSKKTKDSNLSLEERLEQALIPNWDEPYKLPENWCWTKLESIAKWGSGGTPSRNNPEYYIGDIPWIKTGELDNAYIYDTAEHISEKALANSSAKLFPINTVVIAMYGATIGKVGIMGIEATTNQACACAVCSPAINYKYLFYYAISQRDGFIGKGKGGAQPNISQDIIKQHEIPLPPLAEQQRIVARIESLFAKLDETKEKAQEVVDGFETRKAAILHKAFTGELTAQWRKENGVEMESWERTILKNVCKLNPKKIDTNGLPDDLEVSFFPMASLSEIYGEITEPQTKLLKDVKTVFTNFSEGDVVFAKITPCMENGKSAVIGKLVNGIGYGTTEFYVLRCHDNLYNRYLYHMIRDSSFRNKAKSVMSGAVGQQRVPKSFMENYPLNLPSFPEQMEIVRILDSILAKEQQAKEAAEAVLEQIETIKKSILSRAFRGELGTNNPTEESAVELLKQVLNTASEQRKTTVKRAVIPKSLENRIKTDLERKIIKLYFQNKVDVLTIDLIMSVSSKKFDIMEALRDLQQKGILEKENNKYKLLG